MEGISEIGDFIGTIIESVVPFTTPKSLHKISWQSVHNILSDGAYKQTNKQTNTTKQNLLCQGGTQY